MTDDLKEIVSGCRAGDGRAQRQLYERYSAMVFRVAARMVGKTEAADISQEIFLRIFSRISQFRGKAKFSTWLYRVAVNECLRSLRRRSPRWEQLLIEPASLSECPSNLIEQSEFVERALDQLPAELRAVFLLREVEQLSYQEIASILEIPAGTVASQLSRARAELQAYARQVAQGRHP
jgi:RNA polymerase sigma-70 factor (ECF subfamily)